MKYILCVLMNAFVRKKGDIMKHRGALKATTVLIILLISLFLLVQVKDSRASQKGTKPTEVRVILEWGDWTKDNRKPNEIAEFRALFMEAIKRAGILISDKVDRPQLTISFDEMPGVFFTKEAGRPVSVHIYDLSFVVMNRGEQLFIKTYKGTIEGGSATRKIGDRVYLGSTISFEEVRDYISEEIKKDPI
jgi:hypothetical protein